MSRYRKIINGFKKIFSPSSASRSPLVVETDNKPPPRIIPRDQHPISRQNISRNALKVLYKLKDAGYDAYLVGGGVRDLLLGFSPKDFDIATNAKPEDVKAIFRNCRLIGRRFRLAHVHFGPEIIEVATFRAPPDATDEDYARRDGTGMIVRDNVYGSFEQDAWRRDFTVNSLYYNIRDFSVVDHTHQGMVDLEARTLRLIGDPWQRYREDPVRMLRAARFCAKLNFTLHPDTEAPIQELRVLLRDIPSARLYEEVLKLLQSRHARESYRLLRHYGLFSELLPMVARELERPEFAAFVTTVVANTEERVRADKGVTPVFLFAALLWQPMRSLLDTLLEESGESWQTCLHDAGHEVFRAEGNLVMIPKRLTVLIREIWTLQFRMEKATRSKRALRIAGHPRFRAALDFLILRGESDPSVASMATWWHQFGEAEETQRQELLEQPQENPATGDAPRRRRRRRRKPANTTPPREEAAET